MQWTIYEVQAEELDDTASTEWGSTGKSGYPLGIFLRETTARVLSQRHTSHKLLAYLLFGTMG